MGFLPPHKRARAVNLPSVPRVGVRFPRTAMGNFVRLEMQDI